MFQHKSSWLYWFLLIVCGISGSGLHASKAYVPVQFVTSDDLAIINMDTSSLMYFRTVRDDSDRNYVLTSHDNSRVYVTRDHIAGFVSVINPVYDNIITKIPVGREPVWLAITPDDSKLYVANFFDASVSVVNTALNRVTATIPVDTEPCFVGISPNGLRAYVSNFGSVTIIDTTTDLVVTTVGAGNNPGPMAFTPDNSKVYVVNTFSNFLSVIHTKTNTVTSIPYPTGVTQGTMIAITPDGSRVYVSDHLDNFVVAIDTATDTVIGAPIPVGSNPAGVTISPNGQIAYVANNAGGVGFGGTVSIISTLTNTVIDTVNVGGSPWIIGIDPEKTQFVVTNSNNSFVTIVNVANNHFKHVDVGNYNQFVSFVNFVSSPRLGQAFQKRCRFLTQTQVTNIITWKPPRIPV